MAIVVRVAVVRLAAKEQPDLADADHGIMSPATLNRYSHEGRSELEKKRQSS